MSENGEPNDKMDFMTLIKLVGGIALFFVFTQLNPFFYACGPHGFN
jgi:hypothetical protein